MKEGNVNKVFVAYVFLCICPITIIYGQCTKKQNNYDGIIFNKTYSDGEMLACEKNIGLTRCIDACASLGGCSYVNFYPKKLSCALMTTGANLTLQDLVEDVTLMKVDEGNEFVLMEESAVVCGTKKCREGYICLETASGRKSCHLAEKQCHQGRYLVAGLYGEEFDSVVPTNVSFSSVNCSICDQFQLNGPSAWTAGVHDASQYILVTFGSRTLVTGVVTQGCVGGSRVSLYNVMYIACNDVWTYIRDETGQNKAFPGNYDQYSMRIGHFPRPIRTSGIKIHIRSWSGAPIQTRFDLIGC